MGLGIEGLELEDLDNGPEYLDLGSDDSGPRSRESAQGMTVQGHRDRVLGSGTSGQMHVPDSSRHSRRNKTNANLRRCTRFLKRSRVIESFKVTMFAQQSKRKTNKQESKSTRSSSYQTELYWDIILGETGKRTANGTMDELTD